MTRPQRVEASRNRLKVICMNAMEPPPPIAPSDTIRDDPCGDDSFLNQVSVIFICNVALGRWHAQVFVAAVSSRRADGDVVVGRILGPAWKMLGWENKMFAL